MFACLFQKMIRAKVVSHVRAKNRHRVWVTKPSHTRLDGASGDRSSHVSLFPGCCTPRFAEGIASFTSLLS